MAKLQDLARAVVLCGVGILGVATPARGQDIPFAFLVQNGWQVLAQPAMRLDQPLVSWAKQSSFYTVVNGSKGAVAGTARVTVWSRSVPDPLFATIGPIAGVIELTFPTFRGFLGLVETPAGLQTTIGVISTSGDVNPGVTGSWALGNGASVAGGTVDDLVVAGIVRLRSAPAVIGPVAVHATPVFPTVPFASDPSPFGSGLPTSMAGTHLGNFYAAAQGPLRWYRRTDTEWTGNTYDTSLLVMSLHGGNYLVMVCADLDPPGPGPAYQHCTVSGAGTMLGPLTGSMPTYSLGTLGSVTLQLQLYLAP